MPTHNCETCGTKGNCPIESIASWLNEHEKEVMDAVSGCADELIAACESYVRSFPPAIMAGKELGCTTQVTFLLGYHKGRTYQDVPQVFKDDMG